MDGRDSSFSLQGEAYPRPVISSRNKRSYRYKVIGVSSTVDETLFSSHRERRQRKDVGGREPAKGESSPSPGKNRSTANSTPPPIKGPLGCVTPGMKTNFKVGRNTKARPSYVDESLFGKKLDQPDFEPPWGAKKDARFKDPPLTWSPPVDGSLSCTPRSRPGSAQGQRSYSRCGQRSGSSVGSSPSMSGGKNKLEKTPPWK